jgi:hypothetical protein
LDDADHAAVLSALSDVVKSLGFPGLRSGSGGSLGAAPLTALPGALGRMCVVTGCAGYEEEMEMMLAQSLDGELASGRLSAPCLAYLQDDDAPPNGDIDWTVAHLEAAQVHVADAYGLCAPLSALSQVPREALEGAGADVDMDTTAGVAPAPNVIPTATAHVWLDGEDETPGGRFDVSAVAVFDGLVTDPLRRELLKLLARPEGGWDPEAAPDPAVWVPGGLADTTDDVLVFTRSVSGMSDATSALLRDVTRDITGGVGLCAETLEFLCSSPPWSGAIAAVERLFSERLFPDYHVCRMPGAILGDAVRVGKDAACLSWHELVWRAQIAPLVRRAELCLSDVSVVSREGRGS